MKTSLLIVATSLALSPLALAADAQLKDQKDKVSYSIGLDIGSHDETPADRRQR